MRETARGLIVINDALLLIHRITQLFFMWIFIRENLQNKLTRTVKNCFTNWFGKIWLYGKYWFSRYIIEVNHKKWQRNSRIIWRNEKSLEIIEMI